MKSLGYSRRIQPLRPCDSNIIIIEITSWCWHDYFFRYGNQHKLPALVDHGMQWTGTKSIILKCPKALTSPSVHAHEITVNVVDMAADVHMTRSATFSGYIPMHLVSYLKRLLGPTVQCLDIVWNIYPERSLKIQVRLERGNGPHI